MRAAEWQVFVTVGAVEAAVLTGAETIDFRAAARAAGIPEQDVPAVAAAASILIKSVIDTE